MVSLTRYGIYGRVLQRALPHLPAGQRSNRTRQFHERFAARLSTRIPDATDVFVGLSSFSLPAIETARRRGAKITVVDHGSLHERVESRLVREEREMLGLAPANSWPYDWVIESEDAEFAAADIVTVLSHVAKRSLVAEGVPAHKILVNQCGVAVERFQPGRKADDVFRVVQCGAVTPRKGIHYLVAALSALNLPRAELWLVGAVADAPYAERLVGDARGVQLTLKGALPEAELARIYPQCSVAVLASVADGFGLVVPQAMACGLPVVVSDNVGAADLVRDGENGFVVPTRDPLALGDRLERLYRDADMRRTLGESACASVRGSHTWAQHAARLVAHLTSDAARRN